MNELFKIIPAVLRAAGESGEVAEAAAMAAWRRVAGENLLPHAVPFRLYRKTLIVAVTDVTWQRQLESMAGQLIFGLNSLLGQAVVTFVEFRIDPVTVELARGPRAEPPIDRELLEADALLAAGNELHRAAEAISDLELRHRFLVAAGVNLSRER
ncbi:MAG: DciA family protein [Pyrinomonadaceae bacterium]